MPSLQNLAFIQAVARSYTRGKSLIWTNGDPVCCCICASPSLTESMSSLQCNIIMLSKKRQWRTYVSYTTMYKNVNSSIQATMIWWMQCFYCSLCPGIVLPLPIKVLLVVSFSSWCYEYRRYLIQFDVVAPMPVTRRHYLSSCLRWGQVECESTTWVQSSPATGDTVDKCIGISPLLCSLCDSASQSRQVQIGHSSRDPHPHSRLILEDTTTSN